MGAYAHMCVLEVRFPCESQSDLELNPSSSTPHILGFQACTTLPS